MKVYRADSISFEDSESGIVVLCWPMIDRDS